MLNTIEKRPGMYVYGEHLRNISIYMQGYIHAMKDAGIDDQSNPDIDGFHEFVRGKFGFYEATAGWPNMIFSVSLGLEPENIVWKNYDVGATREQHKKSIVIFYKLLNEYREAKKA